MRAQACRFDPPWGFDCARERWMAEKLGHEMQLPVYLPLEMRLAVARRLTREYSAALTSALPVIEAEERVVELTGDVWVVQVNIEGVWYVTRVTTEMPRPDARPNVKA